MGYVIKLLAIHLVFSFEQLMLSEFLHTACALLWELGYHIHNM